MVEKVCRILLRPVGNYVLEAKNGLNARLLVDGEVVDLNEFVEKILSGTLVGAVTSLRSVKKNWKKIELTVTQ